MRATGPLAFSWIQRTDRGSIPPAVKIGRQFAGHHPDHHERDNHADHHAHANDSNHADHADT